MTRDQHREIIAFIQAITGGDQPSMDVEADAIIRALFVRNPDAAYRVTMLAMSLLANAEAQRPQDLPRHKGWFSTLFDKRSGEPPGPNERHEPVTS
ncbi:hypothetical protein [Acidocella sp.]|uniref:hypothetical protein n=1 Tax=Acidocella sp. TaxID=50710 RepID=UPI002F41E5EB